MKRRSFLKGLLLAPVAPAIVKADNIMNIWVPKESHTYDGTYYTVQPNTVGFIVPPDFAEEMRKIISKEFVIPMEKLPPYRENI